MLILLGINSPQYTEDELRAFQEENAKGVTYEGRHYTGYEATQKQRQIESSMRVQKNRILVSRGTGDVFCEQTAQIRLQMLHQHYRAFSKAAGMPLQEERAWVAGFGPKQAKEALSTYETKVIRQTGGKYTVGDPEWALRREDEAVKFYEYVRKQDTDIKRIAKAAGMSVQDVTQIKNHIFFNKHIMWNGSYALFYPQYDMAVAWQRLSTGTPNETDLLLLKHELLESQCEKEYNLTAEQAHRMATKTYDWDGMIFKLYGEAGEPDGVLQID